ncbi:glycosyltransferase family 2 protein [Collinsella sp. An268]|uniref:glycosyltransferase family 2 protein n=1 Tax=Collinsella sp. An268 TaxID=1965612 RepID=UPI000B3796FD|nr:glycosyltransferase family 2 protein [Collinsella sp. An268]
MHNSRVLVVIPAYNEEENIVDTVEHVIDAGYEYIVVNDGSRDNTLNVCRNNNIRVLDLPQNLGIGGAVQAGHKFAQRHGYDIDIQFDGDGQHDARYLDNLVEAIEAGADLAIGSRFLGQTDGFKSTIMRRVGKTWLSGFLKVFAGITVTDPTSGFRACGKRAIDAFCSSYPIDYPEPESIAVAAKSSFVVKEIPVIMHERQGGVSSINALASVYYMIKVSLAIIIACFSRHDKEA